MDLGNGLVVVGVTWLVIGLVIAFIMRRRGHSFWIWFVLGAILGPLAIPLAVERARFHPIEYPAGGPGRGTGKLDVLAGIDDSEESVEAVRVALELFGECMTSLTLARVLDYDSAGTFTGSDAQAEAMSRLREVSGAIEFEEAGTRLLFGRPDEALVEHALSNDMELIVVGARGQGLAETLFGSVTARLVGGRAVPVFVGPRSATSRAAQT